MLILTQTTDSVEILLDAAPVSQLPVLTTYRDVDTSNYNPGRTVINTSGTTPVAVVPAPATGFQRVVDTINVYNPNVANVTLTIRFNANASLFTLHRVTLAQNERLQYQEGVGWQTFTTAGALKNSLNQGTNSVSTGNSRAVLGSDVVNSNSVANTIADITGLQFPVVANQRYGFNFAIRWSSAATTTGARFSINGPTQNELAYISRYALTATTETVNNCNGYDQPAGANASPAFTESNTANIQGIIRPTADGNVIARFASEVANSAITARAGSYVDFWTI